MHAEYRAFHDGNVRVCCNSNGARTRTALRRPSRFLTQFFTPEAHRCRGWSTMELARESATPWRAIRVVLRVGQVKRLIELREDPEDGRQRWWWCGDVPRS